MDNYQIADNFSLLAKLMDIHGENSFKAKSYAAAAFNIEKLPSQLSEIPAAEIPMIKGIGDSAAKKVTEMLQTGRLGALDELVAKTPAGIIEMLLHIKGLGPKKIQTIWKDLGIESIGELLYACQENRLLMYKGFGEKTQENVKASIEFYLKSKGNFLYAEIESYAVLIEQKIKQQFNKQRTSITGEFARQMEIITKLQWVTTVDRNDLKSFLTTNGFELKEENDSTLSFKDAQNIQLSFHLAEEDNFGNILFITSCSPEFFVAWQEEVGKIKKSPDENSIFSDLQIEFIAPPLREQPYIIARAKENKLPQLIQPNDIKGIIHSHSKWSDGSNDIEEMAKACINRGLEYLVISDHSKSAFYANGLSEERIKEQHKQVDELNIKLSPFRIFKSIECDILNDGSLDYSNDVLSSFDLVITSVHSNLSMTEEKAMMRLLNAINHPSTTILGHMTGRLLLSRKGYPVDHDAIIAACRKNNVVIELNAHPRRLDIDWRWISKAIDAGVLISIDPDAHNIEGFDDVKYGVLAAQKGGLSKENNLSSFSLSAFEEFLRARKKN